MTVSTVPTNLSLDHRLMLVGGGGFLGSNLAFLLSDAGNSVAVLDPGYFYTGPDESPMRDFNLRRRESTLLAGLQRYPTCTTDESAVRAAWLDFSPDTVVHFGNWPLTSIPDCRSRDAHHQTLTGCQRLLNVLPGGLKRFVYISSSLVYGEDTTHPLTEDDDCRPNTLYGQLKLRCEHAVVDTCRRHGVEWVIVRPTAVYGPGDLNLRVVQRLLEAGRFRTSAHVIDPDSTRLDFTHIRDVTQGIALASLLAPAANTAFNISGGCSHSLRSLLDLVRSDFPDVNVTESHKGSTGRSRHLDISRARQTLTFDPRVALAAGVAEYADYIKRFAPTASAVPESIPHD